jgi:hypothetical protein
VKHFLGGCQYPPTQCNKFFLGISIPSNKFNGATTSQAAAAVAEVRKRRTTTPKAALGDAKNLRDIKKVPLPPFIRKGETLSNTYEELKI